MKNREALNRLAAEVTQGELVFSTHTQVALQIRVALDDPDMHSEAAAKIVQAEPLLAARAVALANSVAFNRSGNPVSDVRSAVVCLGLNLIRALSTALIMRQIAANPAATHQQLATRLWEHTSHVAALCYVLAKRVSRQNPDAAMFAGIVHEVGGFYLISRAEAYPGLLDEEVDKAWRTGGEALVGSAVLKALAVPEEIATAVGGLWQGRVVLPPKNLADTLFLANCLTPIASPLDANVGMEGNPETRDLPSQVMADAELAAILEESSEELSAIAASLSF